MSAVQNVLIAYYRVSTRQQSRSGLGLEAQRAIVEQFARARGATIAEHFTEQESGRSVTRPELGRALVACRLHRATLVVAKLDRLARNAAFLLSLRDSGVELVACDLPSMNRLAAGVMAVVAEEEARAISERTKAALQAARRRGVTLGNPSNLSQTGRRLGCVRSAATRSERAIARARDLAPSLHDLRVSGSESLRELAQGLNAKGILTAQGKQWTPAAVARVLVLLGPRDHRRFAR